MGHCCGTLLWDTLVGHSSSSPDTPRTKVVLQSRQVSSSSSPQMIRVLKLYYKVASSHLPAPQILRVLNALSPAFRALDMHDLRRGLRAHGTNRTLACISHTRHARSPQRVARQVSKTSVSYETSSKTHTSKSAKRAFRTRLPPKVKRKHPSEHTHHAALPSSFAIAAPPNNIRSQSHFQSPAPATKSDNIISCELQENLHHTTRLE